MGKFYKAKKQRKWITYKKKKSFLNCNKIAWLGKSCKYDHKFSKISA
jgi:hypothetical protein